MANRKVQGRNTLNIAAESAGRALGWVAKTYDAFKEEHPHPIVEASEVLASGQKRLAKLAKAARAGASAILKNAKSGAKKTRKAVKKAAKRLKR